MNVTGGDSRDEEGRQRFLPYQVDSHIFNHVTKATSIVAHFLSTASFYPLKKVYRLLRNSMPLI